MKALSIFIVVLLTTFPAKSQTWQPEPESKSNYLQLLFYNDFDDVLKADNSYFIFTKHEVDHFWKKKNKGKTKILVSTIDENGNIHVTGQINHFPYGSIKRYFNNRVYILSNKSKRINGKKYYEFLAFNKAWEIERSISIPEIADRQMEYEDFVVDKDESVYLISSPYFLNHGPDDFVGSYLVKIDSSGQYLNKYFFENSSLENLQLNNDILSFTANKQVLEDNDYRIDSIESVKLNNSLVKIASTITEAPRQKKGYRRILKLKNGYEVVSIHAEEWENGIEHYNQRIAMLDKTGSLIWKYDFPSHCLINYSTAKELENGTFLLEVEKTSWRTQGIWDTLSVIQFGIDGKQKEIKQYLNGAKPGMVHCSVSSFLEPAKNEIWLFCKRTYLTYKSRIYFEKLHPAY